MTEFAFNPTTLLAALTGGFYKVPLYQRSYSWGKQQVDDYWQDMLRAVRENSQYFLGTLVFSSAGEDRVVSVIDGQQRLATTSILIAAMRDEWRARGDNKMEITYSEYISPTDPEDYEEKPRIRLNATDHPFYEDFIIKRSPEEPKSESHEKIKIAYETLSDNVKKLAAESGSSWKAEFAKIYKFLNQQARVVTVTAPSDSDAFVIFETLNDRGADLTIADLLKNYLFSHAGDDLETVQTRWQSAQTILQEYQTEKEFVTFLRHLWSSMYGATRERDLYRSMRDKIKSKANVNAFSKQIVDAAKAYGAILSTENEFWSKYTVQDLSYLNAIIQFNLQQSRPTLLAAIQTMSQLEIQKTLKSFVAIAVRGLISGGIGGGQAERYFAEAATAIRAKSITTAAEVVAKLQPVIASDTEFQRAFASYTTGNNRFARYLLIALERALETDPEPEYVPNEVADEVNLEHILPKNAKQAEWPAFTSEERAIFPYRLGNMTLLKKGVNGKIGNKPWSFKQPRICTSQLKLNIDVCAQTAWRTGEIEARQIKLAALAVSVWKV